MFDNFEYIFVGMVIIPLLLSAMQIYEGSSVYACAIANKLIDVVDRQYAAAPPTNSTSL